MLVRVSQSAAIRGAALFVALVLTSPGVRAADPAGTELFPKINALADQWKYSEALTLAEEARNKVRASAGENSEAYATALTWHAYILQRAGRMSAAEPLLRTSLEIFRRLLPAGHPSIATALNNLGLHKQLSDRLDEAENDYKSALEMREKVLPSDDSAIADSLNNLAQVYKHQGRVPEAIPLLERSLAIRLKTLKPNDPQIAQSLTNIGAALDRLGRFEQGERYHRKALEIRRAAQGTKSPDVAGAINRLAQNLASQNRFKEADALFIQSAESYASSESRGSSEYANNLHNRAQNLHNMKRDEEAESLLREALAIQRKALPANHPSIAHAISDLALVILDLGRPKEALALIREGTQILVARGKLDALGRQRFLDLVRIAWRAREELKADAEIKPILNEALLFGQRAVATPTAAAVTRMAARFSAANEGLRSIIAQRDDDEVLKERLERALTVALTQGNNPVGRSPDTIRTEIRETEQRIAETDQKLRSDYPRYFDLVRPDPISVGEVQHLLAADEVAIDVIVADEDVYVWAISNDGATWYRASVNATKLADRVATLRNALDYDGIMKAGKQAKLYDLGLAHELYKAILAPASSLLDGKKQILFVANGALTSFPIQMLVVTPPSIARPTRADLHVYREVDWLVRHQAVTVMPSLDSLRSIRERAGKATASLPLIGFGNPVLASATPTTIVVKQPTATRGYAAFWRGPAADLSALREGLPELPETVTELRGIAKGLKASESDLVLGREATESRIKTMNQEKSLSQYKVVYFATHGLIAGEVKGLGEPALVLSLPAVPSEFDDGLLTASEATQLSLDADWVVMSACNTASGERPGAEALSGLARAFFYAGARALLVSHWRVDSDAAAALTTETFQTLETDPKAGRAEALRRAMLRLINEDLDQWHAYPTFWAPFVIVGDGRAIEGASH